MPLRRRDRRTGLSAAAQAPVPPASGHLAEFRGPAGADLAVAVGKARSMVDGNGRRRPAPVARDRRSAARGRRRVGPAADPTRESRAFAVHFRLDRRLQRRHGQPREPDPQLGDDPPRIPGGSAGYGCQLAPHVSRHGAHRRHPRADVRRRPGDAAPSGRFLAAPRRLAQDHHPVSRNDQRRAELRLRAVRREGHRSAESRPGS